MYPAVEGDEDSEPVEIFPMASCGNKRIVDLQLIELCDRLFDCYARVIIHAETGGIEKIGTEAVVLVPDDGTVVMRGEYLLEIGSFLNGRSVECFVAV
jgi:hypothetical protein